MRAEHGCNRCVGHTATASKPGVSRAPGTRCLRWVCRSRGALARARPQVAAVKRYEENEAWSMGMIVEAEADDAFVAALSLKVGGETGVSERL